MKETTLRRIDCLIDSIKIFKIFMGENIEFQKKMIYKKAKAHILI